MSNLIFAPMHGRHSMFSILLTAVLFNTAHCVSSSAVSLTHSSSLTLLFQNSLNWTQNSILHQGLLLSSSLVPEATAQQACATLSEDLADTGSESASVLSDYQNLLNFQTHIRALHEDQLLWVHRHTSNSHLCTAVRAGDVAVSVRVSCSTLLPALCTNSAPYNVFGEADTSVRWRTSVTSGQGRTFTGCVSAVHRILSIRRPTFPCQLSRLRQLSLLWDSLWSIRLFLTNNWIFHLIPTY